MFTEPVHRKRFCEVLVAALTPLCASAILGERYEEARSRFASLRGVLAMRLAASCTFIL